MSTRKKPTKSKKKTPDRACPDTGRPSDRLYEIFGIITTGCALLIGPSLASVQFGTGRLMGPFGELVGGVMNSGLGLCGYLIVVWLLATAGRIFAHTVSDGPSTKSPATSRWTRRLGALLLLSCCAMAAHLATEPVRFAGSSSGGALGEYGAELLRAVLSTGGAWLVVGTGLALSLILAVEISWVGLTLVLWRGAAKLVGECMAGARRWPQTFAQARSWVEDQLSYAQRHHDQWATEGASALPPVVRLDLSDLVSERRPTEPAVEETPARLPDDLEIEHSELDLDHPPTEAAGAVEAKANENNTAPAEEAGPTIVQAHFDSPADISAENEPQVIQDGEELGFVLHKTKYEAPPIDLLEQHGEGGTEIDEAAIKQQAARLTKSLADYKIYGKVTEVHPGPVVTMYEFVPAPGTRISKVASLSNDLAMSLHARRVRIVAPIPGKGAIGIEVPNAKRDMVAFKEIVADKCFAKAKRTGLSLALGKNIFGAPVVMDLAKMPHLLVAGATGAGKSVSVNSMICSLLMRHTPEEVRLLMIDPKFLELSGYNDIPHLLLPVVTDPKKAAVALRWAVAEMERRYQLLADMRVRDIASYNRKIAQQETATDPAEQAPSVQEAAPSEVTKHFGDGTVGHTQLQADIESPEPHGSEHTRRQKKSGKKNAAHMPYLVVIIDEFADLMMVSSKEVETCVARLAQKARACGIHLIVATQRPSVDVITGLIKANFPSRIAFQVASSHDSKTILGSYGAENLLGAGDMLVLDRGADMKRVHGAYLSDDEIHRIIDWLREQGRPVYDMDILKPNDEDESEAGPAENEMVDALYDKAVAIVADSRQASISMVQRRLRIGYNRAARLIEQMEKEGIVGPSDGVKGRQVLINSH